MDLMRVANHGLAATVFAKQHPCPSLTCLPGQMENRTPCAKEGEIRRLNWWLWTLKSGQCPLNAKKRTYWIAFIRLFDRNGNQILRK